jgi:hypothetical protein
MGSAMMRRGKGEVGTWLPRVEVLLLPLSWCWFSGACDASEDSEIEEHILREHILQIIHNRYCSNKHTRIHSVASGGTKDSDIRMNVPIVPSVLRHRSRELDTGPGSWTPVLGHRSRGFDLVINPQ